MVPFRFIDQPNFDRSSGDVDVDPKKLKNFEECAGACRVMLDGKPMTAGQLVGKIEDVDDDDDAYLFDGKRVDDQSRDVMLMVTLESMIKLRMVEEEREELERSGIPVTPLRW